MKKSIIFGMLFAVIMSFCLTGCKDSVNPPEILEAFFAKGVTEQDFFSDAQNKKITTLNLTDSEIQLVFHIRENDKRLRRILISPYSNFSIYTHWTDLDFNNQTNEFWSSYLRPSFPTMDPFYREQYIMNNGTIYMKAFDEDGNASTVYKITGITVYE